MICLYRHTYAHGFYWQFQDLETFLLQDAVINLKSVQDLSKHLGFEWTILAYELGFTRPEVRQFHITAAEKRTQAKKMLECW